jgi:hypothetical protein
MVLDGVMIAIATLALTFMHPGIGFNGRWAEASYPYRIRKQKTESRMTTATQGSGSNSGEGMEDKGTK